MYNPAQGGSILPVFQPGAALARAAGVSRRFLRLVSATGARSFCAARARHSSLRPAAERAAASPYAASSRRQALLARLVM